MQNNTVSPLQDPRVHAVIDRLETERRRPADGGPRANPGASHDPHDYAEYGFSIVPEQGDLIYLLCRGLRATRVVEFATSVGMSTLYFAAAMRDNGGGKVIGAELVPAKVAAARRNLADADLSEYADTREGDAANAPPSGWARGLHPDRRLAAFQRAFTCASGHRDRRSPPAYGRLRHERQRRTGFS